MSYGGYGGGRGGPPPARPGAPGRPTMSPTMGRGGAPRPPNTTNTYATTRGGGGRALPTPGSGGQKKVKAIYDFFGQGPNDLSFKKGDIITVTSEDSTSGPDWWVGEIKGKRGEFPHNHVEIMDDSSSSKPSYNNSSYTNNSSYGNNSYTPPGPSVPMSTFSSNTSSQNNYPSKPTPRAVDDDKPSKPAKSFSGGGGSFSLGDFGDKIPTIGLSLAIICFIFFFVGMCFPWYRTSTLNNNKTRFWGWTGINEYPIYSKSFANPWTTNSIYFRPYKGVLYPHMKSVFDTSFAFCLLGMGALAVQLFLWFKMKQGNLDNNRIIFIAVMVTFLCFLIGFFQIFRFQKAWRTDVDKTCTVTGPCKSWLGKSATYGDWGPALGWWFSLIGFLASTANAIVIYIRVHSDGGIFQLFGR